MGWIADLFAPQRALAAEAAAPLTELVEVGTVETLEHRLDQAIERLVNFQEDRGWESISTSYGEEISREGLTRNGDLVRAFSSMNPLMKRGKTIRVAYVFGDGVDVAVQNQGDKNQQDVEAVVTEYLEDESNRDAVFGAQARAALEGNLFDDGNVFVGHWVDPLTGQVQVRKIPFNEITDIVTKPGDKSTPWFYRREWVERPLTGNGIPSEERKVAYYPALKYQPSAEIKYLNQAPVLWPGRTYPGYGSGAAIYHLKVNPVGRDELWGIGDGYAAMPWARAYKEFLEDWAKLMKALSKIAWHFKDKAGGTQLARTAAQLAASDTIAGTSYGSMEVEAPNRSGATFDAGSGRPLAAMVASALGVTVTILTADPGQEGARAVAETLDRPQRLEMQARREVHAEFYRATTAFAIEQSLKAPRGALKGRLDRRGDRLIAVFPDGTDATVEVTWPPLDDIDQKSLIESIVAADSTGKIPPAETMKLLLRALGYEDIAELVEDNTDADGNWIDKTQAADAAAGNAAADALRRGEDPSDTL